MSEALFSSEAETEAAHAEHDAGEGETLAVSAVDFSALEERVLRTVELLKRERAARSEAEARTAQAEEHIKEQSTQIENLERNVKQLHGERDHVRERVEKLLKQLEVIEL
jgi:septal ring factor EnvC (AmiA/AmiB activator)